MVDVPVVVVVLLLSLLLLFYLSSTQPVVAVEKTHSPASAEMEVYI